MLHVSFKDAATAGSYICVCTSLHVQPDSESEGLVLLPITQKRTSCIKKNNTETTADY